MRAVANILGRLSAGLNGIALWGAVAAVLVMALAGGYQVVDRYVFDAPPVWTEELARRAMVWAGMLGASCAFYQRVDPTLFPQMHKVPGGPGAVLALVSSFGVAVFALPVLYYSLFGPNFDLARGFLGRTIDRKAEMMGISMAWFTAAIPVAFALILIHMLAQLAQSLAGAGEPAMPHTEDRPE